MSVELDVQVKGQESVSRISAHKVLKQLNVCFINLSLGICVGTIGPSFPDLADRHRLNYEELSKAFIFDSLGCLAGAFLAGFILDLIPKFSHVTIPCFMLLSAAGFLLVPFTQSFSSLSIALFVYGCGFGATDVGTNTVVLRMWGLEASMPINSIHFSFGVGTLIAPQIAKSFLGTPQWVDLQRKNESILRNNHTYQFEDDSKIEIPYIVAAVTLTIVALLFVTFHIIKGPGDIAFPSKSGSSEINSSMFTPKLYHGGNTLMASFYLGLLFLFFFNSVGAEYAFGTFLYTYAVERGNSFGTKAAADLNTVYSSVYTGTRCLAILISRALSTDTILLLDVTLYVLVTITLSIWACSNDIILWVYTALIGFCVAPQFPSGISWSNLYLQANSMSTMVLIVGANLGAVTYKYLTGALFDSLGPSSLMYVCCGASILIAINYIIMFCLTRKMRQGRKISHSD